MTVYAYKAADSTGKIVTGTLEAADERAVAAIIHDMGCIPIRILADRSGGKGLRSLLSVDLSGYFQRVSSKDIMLFTQDLSALLKAGLPIDAWKDPKTSIEIFSAEVFGERERSK